MWGENSSYTGSVREEIVRRVQGKTEGSNIYCELVTAYMIIQRNLIFLAADLSSPTIFLREGIY